MEAVIFSIFFFFFLFRFLRQALQRSMGKHIKGGHMGWEFMGRKCCKFATAIYHLQVLRSVLAQIRPGRCL